MYFKFFILFFLLTETCFAITPKDCATILLNNTDQFNSYLSQLIDEKILGNFEIKKFIDSLSKNILLNPIDESAARTNSTLLIHREELEKYLISADLNTNLIVEFLNKILKAKMINEKSRAQTNAETQIPHQQIEFFHVPPGKFRMGPFHRNREIHFTSPIEVMSAPVTQYQWTEIMGENPAHFKGLDHPVESVTWYSAVVFANKLSELRGLKPAYDLSEVKWKKDTRAEDGTLRAESGRPNLINKNSYRLPSRQEQVYLKKSAGKTTSVYYFGNDSNELIEHAWFDTNSNKTTHPVASLKPLIIEGHEFYDILGNVNEWAEEELVILANGSGEEIIHHFCGGGSWNSNSYNCQVHFTGRAFLNRSAAIGFRLVRTQE